MAKFYFVGRSPSSAAVGFAPQQLPVKRRVTLAELFARTTDGGEIFRVQLDYMISDNEISSVLKALESKAASC